MLLLNQESGKFEVHVYPMGALSSNCTIILSKECNQAVIFDAGNDPDFILNFLNKNNLQLTKLIHTQSHFDHIGASSVLQNNTHAKTYLHVNEKEAYKDLNSQAAYWNQTTFETNPIDFFFEHGYQFNSSDEKEPLKGLVSSLKVLYTPGHSPGSVCFYTNFFETPLLVAGDTLFKNTIGRTDFPGGDYKDIINSIKTELLILPDETIVIAGHGENTTIGREREINPFLK